MRLLLKQTKSISAVTNTTVVKIIRVISINTDVYIKYLMYNILINFEKYLSISIGIHIECPKCSTVRPIINTS